MSPDYPSPSELYQDRSGGSPVACLSIQRSPRMPPLLDAPVFGEEEEQPPLWCILRQLWEASAILKKNLDFRARCQAAGLGGLAAMWQTSCFSVKGAIL